MQTPTGLNPPREGVVIQNNTSLSKHFKVVIKLSSGDSSPITFKIVGDPSSGRLSNYNTDNKHIYGHPGYPNVIGVAAYNAESVNQIASYSSGGTLRMYSTTTNTWSDQFTPIVTATAGVSTYVGSQGYWKYLDGTNIEPFYGTSAAAPHIAAIAALYFSKYVSRSRDNFIDALKNSAVSIGGKGGNYQFDQRAGYGKANALACLNHDVSNPPPPADSPYIAITNISPTAIPFGQSTVSATIT